MLIELTLICALAQPPRQVTTTLPPSHQIALVFSDTNTVLIRLDDAQRLHRALTRGGRLPRSLRIRLLSDSTGVLKRVRWSKEDRVRVFAALTIALGTLPDAERLSAPPLGTRERMDWEVRRGVRPPLQQPEKVRP